MKTVGEIYWVVCYTFFMKLLIVEDEVKLVESLTSGLTKEGYLVESVTNGLFAEQRIIGNHNTYDLILLDLMIPGKEGLQLCKDLRKQGITTPILMLTARDTKADIVKGLDYGADDYLVKPFAFEELLARIRALIRRPPAIIGEEIVVGSLVMNIPKKQVTLDGEPIRITAKEFSILEFLMRNPGRVVTREEVLAGVWDFAYTSWSNVVDVHIKNLRKKLTNKKHHEILETVRGTGYRLHA